MYVFTWGCGEWPHEERHPVEAALVDRVVVGGHDHLCVQLVGSLVCWWVGLGRANGAHATPRYTYMIT